MALSRHARNVRGIGFGLRNLQIWGFDNFLNKFEEFRRLAYEFKVLWFVSRLLYSQLHMVGHYTEKLFLGFKLIDNLPQYKLNWVRIRFWNFRRLNYKHFFWGELELNALLNYYPKISSAYCVGLSIMRHKNMCATSTQREDDQR